MIKLRTFSCLLVIFSFVCSLLLFYFINILLTSPLEQDPTQDSCLMKVNMQSKGQKAACRRALTISQLSFMPMSKHSVCREHTFTVLPVMFHALGIYVACHYDMYSSALSHGHNTHIRRCYA